MIAAQLESRLVAQDKSVVAPGQVLAEGMEYLPSQGTYRKNDRIYANQTGLLAIEGKVLKLIPLAGVYLPKRGDVIIGRVIDILMTGWRFSTNSPYSAVLPLKDATFDYIKKGADLTTYFDLDEYVVCKIFQVTSQNLVDVSMKGPGLRKLKGGRVLKVNAAKVPRIIGKRGSMVSMIKQATGCAMIVGQNGLVWLAGEPAQEVLAVNAIRKIEREAHVPGLTERMRVYLEAETGKKIDMSSLEQEDEFHSRDREGGERRDYGERREYRGGGERGGFRSRDDRGGFRGRDRDGGGFSEGGDRPPRRDDDRPREGAPDASTPTTTPPPAPFEHNDDDNGGEESDE